MSREIKATYNISFFKDFPFPLGSKVFVVRDKNDVLETTVCSYKVEIFKDKEKLIAIPQAISSENLILRGKYFDDEEEISLPIDYAPIYRIYKSKEEAEDEASFITVAFEDEVWLKAIGRRASFNYETLDYEDIPEDEDIENSELHPCCANISSARDLLTKAWKLGGLIKRDVRILKSLLSSDIDDKIIKEMPNLKMILDALGVNWEEDV